MSRPEEVSFSKRSIAWPHLGQFMADSSPSLSATAHSHGSHLMGRLRRALREAMSFLAIRASWRFRVALLDSKTGRSLEVPRGGGRSVANLEGSRKFQYADPPPPGLGSQSHDRSRTPWGRRCWRRLGHTVQRDRGGASPVPDTRCRARGSRVAPGSRTGNSREGIDPNSWSGGERGRPKRKGRIGCPEPNAVESPREPSPRGARGRRTGP